MGKVETRKVPKNEKEYLLLKKSKGMMNGTTIEFDKVSKVEISEDYMDKLIDDVMNDVHGTMYLTSRGIASLMELEHHNLLKDTITPMLDEVQVHFVKEDKPWFIETTYIGKDNAKAKEY